MARRRAPDRRGAGAGRLPGRGRAPPFQRGVRRHPAGGRYVRADRLRRRRVGATLRRTRELADRAALQPRRRPSGGQNAYGIFDTGTAYDTKDLSWHTDLSHAVGPRFTGTATFNYFRNEGASIDGIADPTVNLYAILEGTPGAILPERPPLVRFIIRTEFDAIAASGATPGPNQFLAFTPFGVGDFPSTSRTEFRRPAVKYQGDYAWGNGQRLSAGYEWERETNPLVDGFYARQQRRLRPAAVQRRRPVVPDHRRPCGLEGKLRDLLQPETVGGRLPASLHVGRRVVREDLREHRQRHQVADLHGAVRRLFADPSPGLKVERARTADLGVEATFANQRGARIGCLFRQQVPRPDRVLQLRSGLQSGWHPGLPNIAGSKARGMELEGSLLRGMGGLTASASYAFVETEVEETIQTGVQFQPGQPLLRRPRHSGMVRLTYTRGIASVHAEARFVGQRHDSSFLSLQSVPNVALPRAVTTDITVNPGYTVAGLGVDLRAHRMLTVFLRANNIADTEYESALGYPGMPRSVMVGTRFGFDLR